MQVVQNRCSFLQNDLAVQVIRSWVVIVLRDEFQLRLALSLPNAQKQSKHRMLLYPFAVMGADPRAYV